MHTTNTSGRATKVDESSGMRKSKVGTREGDGVGPNKANRQWNRKRKGDRSTIERRSNINERNDITSTGMK